MNPNDCAGICSAAAGHRSFGQRTGRCEEIWVNDQSGFAGLDGSIRSIQSFLKASDHVHAFVQNGKNQGRLIIPGQTKKVMVSCSAHSQAGQEVVASFVGALSCRQFRDSSFDFRDVGLAL